MDEPVGYALYHPVIGWNLDRAAHRREDLQELLDFASPLWEIRPLYSASQTRPPND